MNKKSLFFFPEKKDDRSNIILVLLIADGLSLEDVQLPVLQAHMSSTANDSDPSKCFDGDTGTSCRSVWPVSFSWVPWPYIAIQLGAKTTNWAGYWARAALWTCGLTGTNFCPGSIAAKWDPEYKGMVSNFHLS